MSGMNAFDALKQWAMSNVLPAVYNWEQFDSVQGKLANGYTAEVLAMLDKLSSGKKGKRTEMPDATGSRISYVLGPESHMPDKDFEKTMNSNSSYAVVLNDDSGLIISNEHKAMVGGKSITYYGFFKTDDGQTIVMTARFGFTGQGVFFRGLHAYSLGVKMEETPRAYYALPEFSYMRLSPEEQGFISKAKKALGRIKGYNVSKGFDYSKIAGGVDGKYRTLVEAFLGKVADNINPIIGQYVSELKAGDKKE